MHKQLLMLLLIYEFYQLSEEAVKAYVSLDDILACPFKEKIGRAKYIPESELAGFDEIFGEMNAQIKALMQGGEDDV